MALVLLIGAVASMALMGWLVLSAGKHDPVEQRVEEVCAGVAQSSAPVVVTRAGMVVPPAVGNAPRATRPAATKPSLRDRLIQAGLYRQHSLGFFIVLRGISLTFPAAIAIAAVKFGLLSAQLGLLMALSLGIAGLIGPSFWLDHKKADRQKQIRRALPDALDIIVVCIEGGLSVPSAFSRVACELAEAHPLLAVELRIVEREIQMGRTTAEALRAFAKRFDLEEIRSLAAVINQAERYGTSVVQALTVYAETMRVRRQQRAEELAHRAVIKVIFPTLLCILPSLFVVILGPAAMRIYDHLIGPGGVMHR